MNKILTFLILGSLAVSVKAQTQLEIPAAQPFGKVDKADLEMTSCDFEKDANAEVLFNVGKIYWNDDLKSIINEVHKRVKIFNDHGMQQANVHLEYYSLNREENIIGIEAETINLVDGKIEITKLDKKSIYNNNIDKVRSEITFAMPNVKPGCIIEYKYKWFAHYNASIPFWFFQEDIPVRYNELKTSIPDIFYFRPQPRISQPMVKHTVSTEATVLKIATHTFSMNGANQGGSQETETYPYNVENEVRALANIPSLRADAYMSSFADNVQYLGLQLVSVRPIGGFNKVISDTWAQVGWELANDDDFGSQLNRSLNNEDDIINKASALKTDDDKIAFVFNQVKNAMKWNGRDRWYTNDGTSRAWENKTGNSAEINLILYHLLKKSGVDAYPMVVSTRGHGKVDENYTSLIQFNRAVVYVPVDSTKNYVLDATGKYNLYNETPAELLNSLGLYIDKSKKTYRTVNLKRDLPVRQVVLINAEIKAGGKLDGIAQISSTSYDRVDAIKRYKTDGEKKYTDSLRDNDNNLKISSLKLENMEVDSLPLTQNIAFSLDLTGSDGNYIYLNTNLFTSFKKNPFLSETRLADIYFGYRRSYSINNVFKIPAGYKTDALPKSVNMAMPDKSFSFKRFVGEQEGTITIHYTISFNVAKYSNDYYPEFHDFFKKMYEIMNEQIVLKKI
jgi:hypothetical protein